LARRTTTPTSPIRAGKCTSPAQLSSGRPPLNAPQASHRRATSPRPVESFAHAATPRRSAIKARPQAINQSRPLSTPRRPPVREGLLGSGPPKRSTSPGRYQHRDALDPRGSARTASGRGDRASRPIPARGPHQSQQVRWVLVRLARHIQQLNAEVAECDAMQRQLLGATAPGREVLAPRHGPGPRPRCSAPLG
jgi:hypothetical protein